MFACLCCFVFVFRLFWGFLNLLMFQQHVKGVSVSNLLRQIHMPPR